MIDIIDIFDDENVTVVHNTNNYTGVKTTVDLASTIEKQGTVFQYKFSVYMLTTFLGTVDEYVTIDSVEYIIINTSTTSAYIRIDLGVIA